jgi:16S rRNA U516 pseudouridylate synthase RsuA-like enzyme
MCEMAGMPVQRLIRVQEGSLKLGTLPKGKWRYLTKDEVQRFKN